MAQEGQNARDRAEYKRSGPIKQALGLTEPGFRVATGHRSKA